MIQILSNGSLTSGLSDEAITAILAIALIFGIVIALAGRLLWKPFMAIIGGFVGAVVGYTLGTYFGGFLLGLLGALIGGFVGSLLFGAFVEAAISLLAGLAVFGIAFASTGNLLISMVPAVIVFVLAAVFIEKIIGVLTAVIGGLIVGVCLAELEIVSTTMAAVLALLLIIIGSVFQAFFLADRDREPRRSPPSCSRCGGQMSFDRYNSRWYCSRCDVSAPPPPPDTW